MMITYQKFYICAEINPRGETRRVFLQKPSCECFMSLPISYMEVSNLSANTCQLLTKQKYTDKSEMESIHLRIKSCTSLIQTNGIIFTTKAKVLNFWFALFAFFAQKVGGKCLQKSIFYMQNMYDSC